jgi:hypothetical protein
MRSCSTIVVVGLLPIPRPRDRVRERREKRGCIARDGECVHVAAGDRDRQRRR